MIKSNRKEYVNTIIWKTDSSFVFPEQQPEHPDYIGSKCDVGICFSGGGTRSASCTHGQLKALYAAGLLDKVGYVLCVSGGAWAALPFTYLDKHWTEGHFFGAILEPESLTYDVLSSIHKRNYLHTVTHAGILDDMIKYWLSFSTDKTFSRAVGKIFLDHFDLNKKNKWFANSQNHVDDILSRNEKLKPSDFYTPHPKRPFLIATGAFLRPGDFDYLYEMTPWYSGINKLYEGGGVNGSHIGGNYIESFASDSDSPDSVNNDVARVRIGSRRHCFTLSDVLGITGAAPSEVLNSVFVDDIGFPELKYWSAMGDYKAKEYEIGDGGNIENLGILPLIKRDVSKIIVFVNTKKPLSLEKPSQVNSAVRKLFKEGDVNHIFPKDKLEPLMKGFLGRLAEGKAILYRDTYSVLENKHHGINPKDSVDILWVYNHNYQNWEKKLPEEMKDKLQKGQLANFPHFATFMENPPKMIDLSPIQANLLSHMSCSVVRDNMSLFEDLINES